MNRGGSAAPAGVEQLVADRKDGEAMTRALRGRAAYVAKALRQLVALHGLVLDIAEVFRAEVIVQAEFRLIIEPEFYKDVQSGGGQVWGKTAYELALRAKDDGLLREDADPDKFTRVLAASLAGQRYMADLIASSGDLGEWFEESLEVVLEAMATPQWLETFHRDGWPQVEFPDTE